MKKLVAHLLLILSVVGSLYAAEIRGETLTKEQWRQDLQYLAKELPRRHKNAFHTVSRETFERAVAELELGHRRHRLAELDDRGGIGGCPTFGPRIWQRNGRRGASVGVRCLQYGATFPFPNRHADAQNSA